MKKVIVLIVAILYGLNVFAQTPINALSDGGVKIQAVGQAGRIAYLRSTDLNTPTANGRLGMLEYPFTNWDSAWTNIGGTALSNTNNTTGVHFLPGSYTITGTSGWTTLATNNRYYNMYASAGSYINFTGAMFNQTSMANGGIDYRSDGVTRISATTNNYDEVPATSGRFRFYSKVLELQSRSGLNTSCFNAVFKENSISGDVLRMSSSSGSSLWQPSTYSGYPNVPPIVASFNVDFKTVELLGDRFLLFSQATRLYDSEININLGTVMPVGGAANGFTPYYFGYDANSVYRRNSIKVNISNLITTGTGSIFANARLIPAVGPTIDSSTYSIKIGTLKTGTTDLGYFNFTGKGSTFVIDVDAASINGNALNFVGGSYDSCTFIVRGNYESSTSLLSISGGTFTANCRIILDGDFKVTSANPVINITGGTIPAGVIRINGSVLNTNNATSINSSSSVTILSLGARLIKPLGSNVLISGSYYGSSKNVSSVASATTTAIHTFNNSAVDADVFVVSADPESSVTASAGDVAIRTNGDFLSKTGTGNTGWSKFLRLKDNLTTATEHVPLVWDVTGLTWKPADYITIPSAGGYALNLDVTTTGSLTGISFNDVGTTIGEFIYNKDGSGNLVMAFTGQRNGGGVDEYFTYDGTAGKMVLGGAGNMKLRLGNVIEQPFTDVASAGYLSANHSVQYISLSSAGTVTIPTSFNAGTELALCNTGTTNVDVVADTGETLASTTLSPGQAVTIRKKGTTWYKF